MLFGLSQFGNKSIVNDPEDIYIRFSVLDGQINTADNKPLLLGEALVQATKLMNEKTFFKSQSILLYSRKDQDQKQLINPRFDLEDETADFDVAGNLLIQSLFVPDMKTRKHLNIREKFQYFSSPEAFRHYQMLIKHQDFDEYHYSVPISEYLPEKYDQDTLFKTL
jgi:hypothetical protein